MHSAYRMSTEKFVTPILKNGRYSNPWEDKLPPSGIDFFWQTRVKNKRKPVPTKEQIKDCKYMNVTPLNKVQLLKLPQENIHCTWLGHAGFLVQINGYNVLFDPILTDSIGPIPRLGKYFIPRYCPSPCTVKDLPPIDIVCISHDHYDHLDYSTIVSLYKSFPKIIWCVTLGMKSWFQQTVASHERIIEFNWWEDKHVFENFSSSDKKPDLMVSLVPAQHWGKRGIRDDNTRLWGGWIVTSSKLNQKVYHAGDTGYCKIFETIGEKYGPIDVALLPIGNYAPRPWVHQQHIDPGEAVKIHIDVKAKKSIAMHWGTFALGTIEDHFEPPILLKKEMEIAGLTDDEFLISAQGETLSF